MQLVQCVELVSLAVGEMNECKDGATQVQQGVKFDSSFVLSKRCPRTNRNAQFYCRGIEGVNGCVQIDRQRVLGIQLVRYGHQVLRETIFAAHNHVIQPLGLGAQNDLVSRKDSR